MASRRQRQVAELLHEEISQLLQHGTRDPRLGFVTVTGVDVSPDLRVAWVYVTTLGDDAERQETLAGLASASPFFRREMRKSLSLRYIPELNFKVDTSLEYGMRIDKILDSIKEESDNSPDAEAP
ncbi:MAG: Ribosome-binding factor A [Anaerolineae bacterium]|nr:Ribosome-binding factor A [Anaerolineae bacterium]